MQNHSKSDLCRSGPKRLEQIYQNQTNQSESISSLPVFSHSFKQLINSVIGVNICGFKDSRCGCIGMISRNFPTQAFEIMEKDLFDTQQQLLGDCREFRTYLEKVRL